MAQVRVYIVIAAVTTLILATIAVTVTVKPVSQVSPMWVSNTTSPEPRNQFQVGVLRTGETSLVFAPSSGQRECPTCGLIALAGSNGNLVWSADFPPTNQTANKASGLTITDFDSDETQEVLIVAAGGYLLAFDSITGRQDLRVPIGIPHGNPAPVVANLTRTPTPDIVVTGPDGVVRVVSPDGRMLWRQDLGGHVFTKPRVDDFDADDTPEIAVAATDGGLTLLAPNGTVEWQQIVSTASGDAVLWLTTAPLDSDPAIELVVGTANGTVGVLDGKTGIVQWRRSVGELAAVRAVFDGDSDGVHEVYAAAAEGSIYMIDGTTGTIEWKQTLTNQSIQMTPPPVAGDLDGEGERELVVVTHIGKIAVLNPRTGQVVASRATNRTVYAPPTLANIDQDRGDEILVMFANGDVGAYDFRESHRLIFDGHRSL